MEPLGARWRWGGRAGLAFLLVGFAIRESFSSWTGHPFDLEVWIRTGHQVAHGQNPYVMPWPPVAGVSFGYTNQALPSAAYLPFWPDVFGGTYLLWTHLGGGNPLVLYFLLKQGPILGDVAVALLLYQAVFRATGDTRAATGALAFWSLFPYDILVGAIWGQLDSVTTALVLVVLLTPQVRAVRRSLVWGVGIFVKWVTVIYLPFEVFRQRGWRRLAPFLAGAVAVGLTLLAFWAAGWSFGGIVATSTSESAGGGGGMNYAQLFQQLGGQPTLQIWLAGQPLLTTILTDLWIPVVFLAGWLAARWVVGEEPGQELRALLFVTAASLLVRWGFNEQYMLYPFALLVVDVYSRHPARRPFFYLLAVLASGYFLTNDFLGVWMVSPVDANAFVWSLKLAASPTAGVIRYWLLDAFAILITIEMVQFVWILWKDDPAPRPWLFPIRPLRSSAGAAEPARTATTPG